MTGTGEGVAVLSSPFNLIISLLLLLLDDPDEDDIVRDGVGVVLMICALPFPDPLFPLECEAVEFERALTAVGVALDFLEDTGLSLCTDCVVGS